MSHPSRDTLWRYATARLPAHRRGEVREHAAECDRCRVQLRRSVVAQRALGASDDLHAPSSRELRAWRDELMQRAQPPEPWRLPRWSWVGGLAAVSLAFGLVLVVTPPSVSEPEPDTLVSRSGVAQGAPVLHLRVVCVLRSGDGDTSLFDPDRGACPQGSFLKVLVGRGATARRWAAVLMVHGERVSFVYPRPGTGDSLQLPESVTPLRGSWPLDPALRGRVKIVALALAESSLSRQDPLVAWAARAPVGEVRDLLGRADATVIEIEVGARR